MRYCWHETAAAGVSVMDRRGHFAGSAGSAGSADSAGSAGSAGFVVAAGAGLSPKIDQELPCLRVVLDSGSIQKSCRRAEMVPERWWQMLERPEAESLGEGCGFPR